MMALGLAGALFYIWINYAAAFSVLLWHMTPAPYADTAYQFGPFIFAGVLILGLMLLSAMFRRWTNRGGDGLKNSALFRRLIGMAAGTALLGALFWGVHLFVIGYTGGGLLAKLAGWYYAWKYRGRVKVCIGRGTRPIRRLFRMAYVGLGGSAQMAGMLEEWAHPWKPGMILLGRSMYDPKWLVGIPDDRHTVTIATSRAGKNRSVVLPNLLTWPGSALVIDPKGQNAYVTALKRGKGLNKSLGQTVHILDPMGEIKDPELMKLVGRFNPLDTLNPKALDYVECVRNIADALVVPSDGHGESVWDNASRSLIAGLIDYVMRSPNVEQYERNLATVRGVQIHPDGPPIEEMLSLGGLAQAGASQIADDNNTSASVKFTANVHTDWLDSLSMQKGLATSDFKLTDLNAGNTTIYLVLPPRHLDTHGRFLRLFVNLSLQAATEGRKGKYATLFLLDEFYALGRLQQLAKGAGLLAGYGIKLWPIVQNLGQLQELYPRNWETFLGNAGLWTAFAMNDATTAQYLSDRLGKRIRWRRMKGPNGYEWEISGVANLRDALELSRAVSRESSKMAVFIEGGDTFLLGRAPYDHIFKRSEYSPDPSEPRRPSMAEMFAELKRQFRKEMGLQTPEKQDSASKPDTALLTYKPAVPFDMGKKEPDDE